jgi:hypothetical protein
MNEALQNKQRGLLFVDTEDGCEHHHIVPVLTIMILIRFDLIDYGSE